MHAFMYSFWVCKKAHNVPRLTMLWAYILTTYASTAFTRLLWITNDKFREKISSNCLNKKDENFFKTEWKKSMAKF